MAKTNNLLRAFSFSCTILFTLSCSLGLRPPYCKGLSHIQMHLWICKIRTVFTACQFEIPLVYHDWQVFDRMLALCLVFWRDRICADPAKKPCFSVAFADWCSTPCFLIMKSFFYFSSFSKSAPLFFNLCWKRSPLNNQKRKQSFSLSCSNIVVINDDVWHVAKLFGRNAHRFFSNCVFVVL